MTGYRGRPPVIPSTSRQTGQRQTTSNSISIKADRSEDRPPVIPSTSRQTGQADRIWVASSSSCKTGQGNRTPVTPKHLNISSVLKIPIAEMKMKQLIHIASHKENTVGRKETSRNNEDCYRNKLGNVNLEQEELPTQLSSSNKEGENCGECLENYYILQAV
jgi:hypothetical protein